MWTGRACRRCHQRAPPLTQPCTTLRTCSHIGPPLLQQADFLHRRQGLAGSRSGSSCVGCPAASLFPEAASVGTPGRAPPPPPGSSSWREAYRERAETEANWRLGQCGWRRLEGHKDYIRCAQLVGASLATCSGSYMQRDCSIR